MKRKLFHFDLPAELIAQNPIGARDGARMLVVDASNGAIAHSSVMDLGAWLPGGSILVPNNVKVRRARLVLRRVGGGTGEALLLKSLGSNRFEALLRPGAKLRAGKSASIVGQQGAAMGDARLIIEKELGEGIRIVRLEGDGPFGQGPIDWDAVDAMGLLPLPPYIKRKAGIEDDERYQTVFHSGDGEAVAAPTAGLHFTPSLIDRLKGNGCLWSPISLNVGFGTFRPMTAEDIEDHAMHEESFEIPETTAKELEKALADSMPGAAPVGIYGNPRPIAAIGTTSLRAMEAAWDGAALKRAGTTGIFIRPGYKIRTAEYLLTNFHLPESTLFVLVSALLGLDLAHRAYNEAIHEKYRFFSYGDAMLILNISKH
jgi:S-adenosylmethionine:tRNA ribosyltransferase-isomerase